MTFYFDILFLCTVLVLVLFVCFEFFIKINKYAYIGLVKLLFQFKLMKISGFYILFWFMFILFQVIHFL